MPQIEMGADLRQLATGVAESDSAALSELTAELLKLPAKAIRLSTRAAFLLGDPALAEVRGNLTAQAGTFAVHESQRITGISNQSLSAGASVLVSTQADARSARLGFQIEDTEAALETRVRFLTPEAIRALSAPELQTNMLGQGAQTFATLPLAATHIARYTTLAHDPNPLHVDKAAAQAAGFKDVIAPGMLLCALAEMAFAQTSPNTQIQDLRARFLSPALVNTSVQVVVSQTSKTKSRVFVVSETQDIHAIVDIFTAA
ncbi:MaoC family dehydratase [Shimia sp.]|jgi:acyl dehydratase|uniref:MaoC family dehydratase n=1 Tax=unclassified Shimia TaxID=2630038 RepID=UPI0025F70861|nr:MaoC family dehydratase [Shimia sp.]MCH2069473.1 MaoC family dehydratase [Shimia sp.]